MRKQSTDYAFPENLTGEDIRLLRHRLHMTRKQLALFLDVSIRTIEHWENGNGTITGPVRALYRILEERPELVDYYEVPEREWPLRLYYMFRNYICTIIDVDERARRVRIRNYTNDMQFRAFGAVIEPDYGQYEEFLESRCFPRSRDKMKLVLRELNLPFYDPFLIIEKTEGRMAEDEFWIRIER